MEEKRFEALYPEDTRYDEIEKTLRYIQEGNFCQLVGVPGVGKGSLLSCLSYNRSIRIKHLGEKQAAYHFVRVNCKELRQRLYSDIVKLLFLALVDSVRDRRLEKEHEAISTMLKESLALGDELVLVQGFKRAVEYLALERDLTVVFLLEQFQAYVPSSEFFLLLSELKTRASYHFSVVFSLNRPLEQMIDPAMYDDVYPLIAGHTVYLHLSDAPSLTFELEHVQKQLGKILLPTLQDEILRLSGGHSKMARVCAEEVLANEETLRQAQNDNSALRAFFLENRAVRNVSYEIWNSLNPQEQSLLKQISLGKLLDRTNSEIEKVLSYLSSIELLRNNEFTIPLFKEFVVYRAKHLSDDKITFRAETQDILKGDTVFTNKLTAAEFRLLQYLLQHPDQVIERDQVVQIVWKDAQSTAGVTDQAIDQLLFRLRRKIEDDPNSPTHLLTVKGRGVRFVP